MKQRMYKPGKLLRTPMQVARATERGQWLYLHNRVTHPSWVYNMQLGTVVYFLKRGAIRLAVRNANDRVERLPTREGGLK